MQFRIQGFFVKKKEALLVPKEDGSGELVSLWKCSRCQNYSENINRKHSIENDMQLCDFCDKQFQFFITGECKLEAMKERKV